MLSVKAREATNTIFKVFGMIQLKMKSSLPCYAGEHSNHALGHEAGKILFEESYNCNVELVFKKERCKRQCIFLTKVFKFQNLNKKKLS